MEKVKFSNGNIFEIKSNGIKSDDSILKIALVAPDTDLTTIESLATDQGNVKRIELLSETGELMKIYSGYSVLTSIEKKKDEIVSVKHEEVIGEITDEVTGETVEGVIDIKQIINRSDVIYITLRKESESEARLTSLEETVDMLVLSALEV